MPLTSAASAEVSVLDLQHTEDTEIAEPISVAQEREEEKTLTPEAGPLRQRSADTSPAGAGEELGDDGLEARSTGHAYLRT